MTSSATGNPLAAGDLVVLPFPFSNPAQAKLRPAVLLTTPDTRGDFVALAVTSRGGHAAGVALDAGGMLSGTLPKPSWVRADKLYTFHTGVVHKRIGQVAPAVISAVLALTCPLLGCK